MSSEVYLDNNATTWTRSEVVDCIVRSLAAGAQNPSSGHSSGARARSTIESARQQVSALLGAFPENLIFTSGATEANNLVLLNLLEKPKNGRSPTIVTTTVEHSSILESCEYLEDHGANVVRVGVDPTGRVRLEELFAKAHGADLVSIQWANNETGVVQPIDEIGRWCKEAKVLFHSDAAQAFGKLWMNLGETPVDFVSITAHKIHGPSGIGGIFAREHAALTPRQRGGGQEHGIRPGTENLPGIVGFGSACDLRRRQLATTLEKMRYLRDDLESRILAAIPYATINGSGAERICNTTNIRFGDLDGQAIVAQLDSLGVRCSQTSACTSRRPEPSHVLRAMGLNEDEAWSSIRFSVSEFTTKNETELAATAILRVVDGLSRNSLRKHAG